MKKRKAKKVLCCDDDEGILDLLSILLNDLGLEVLIVNDGAKVIDLAKRELPDLIFLDLWMPKQSGEVLCEKLKLNPYTKSIPVILLSAHKNVHEKAALLKAEAFLFKPFEINDIEKIVRNYL